MRRLIQKLHYSEASKLKREGKLKEIITKYIQRAPGKEFDERIQQSIGRKETTVNAFYVLPRQHDKINGSGRKAKVSLCKLTTKSNPFREVII